MKGLLIAHWYKRVHPEDRDAFRIALQNAIKRHGDTILFMRLLAYLDKPAFRYVQDWPASI